MNFFLNVKAINFKTPSKLFKIYRGLNLLIWSIKKAVLFLLDVYFIHKSFHYPNLSKGFRFCINMIILFCFM